MVFTASLDKVAKGLTVAVTLLFVGIFAANTYRFFEDGAALGLLISLLLLVTYVLCYVLRITGYSLTPDTLIIHRPANNKLINRSEIENAELLPNGLPAGTIRSFGNGGLFGYFGKFYTFKIGATTWYATRRTGMVMLHLANEKKIIITPDDAAGFVAELAKKG